MQNEGVPVSGAAGPLMCLMMSLLKHLMMTDATLARLLTLRLDTEDFCGMEVMFVVLKLVGITAAALQKMTSVSFPHIHVVGAPEGREK